MKPLGENASMPMWIGVCDRCGAHTDIFPSVTKTKEKILGGDLKDAETTWLSGFFYIS